MSTNVPSLSSEVAGAVLATVSLTCSPSASSVKSPCSERPAIVRLTSVPVTRTRPAAVSNSAVRLALKATPGIVVVTAPVKEPVTPVAAIVRFALAPLIVSTPPPSESAALVTVEADVAAGLGDREVAGERLAEQVQRAAGDREAQVARAGQLELAGLAVDRNSWSTAAPVVLSCSVSAPVRLTPGTLSATVPLNWAARPALRTSRSPLPSVRLDDAAEREA